MTDYKLTEYSHGSGCGCKIEPQMLDNILKDISWSGDFPDLLVGNEHKDDAAVIGIDDNRAIISTTDFFMPIVDDPFDFGRIAATNAISDIYAMGGKPILAISIFGWPIDKLPEEVGKKVVAGGRQVCLEAGIPLAGGHSIDAPEPIFGLAVTGIVDRDKLKTNAGAKPGDLLFLTKPLGVGILTTAEKNKILLEKDKGRASAIMLKSNEIGLRLSGLKKVNAITDVTGFGFLGHLIEMCEASGVSAKIEYDKIPVIGGLDYYMDMKSSPGGTFKNHKSYGHKVSELTKEQKLLLCDPQTSGGLLISVQASAIEEINSVFETEKLSLTPIGQIIEKEKTTIKLS